MRAFVSLLVFAAAAVGVAAAPFRNLDFEEGSTNHVQFVTYPTTGVGDTAEILPGWQLYHGADVQPWMFVDGSCTDCGSASLADVFYGPPFPIQGKYGLYIETARGVAFSIVQRGDIPSDATFLRYEFSGFPFSLSINGERLPFLFTVFAPLAGGTAPVLFDVSKFAGQNVELKLTTFLPDFGFGRNSLDNIQFLSSPRIEIHQQSGLLLLSWPANWPSPNFNFLLQNVTGLSTSNNWQRVDSPWVQVGVNMTTTQAVAGASGFFRLSLTTK